MFANEHPKGVSDQARKEDKRNIHNYTLLYLISSLRSWMMQNTPGRPRRKKTVNTIIYDPIRQNSPYY